MKKEIKKSYKKCWKYFLQTKNYLIFSCLLFILFGLIGYFFPVFFQDKILEIIKGLVEKTKDLGFFRLFLFILFNNVKSSALFFLLGIVFSFFPIIGLIVNGYFAGFVANIAVSKTSVFVLWRLFPHGIFEIPAVLFSAAMGIRLGVVIFTKEKLKDNFREGMRFFLLVILPLLLIAAIIEAGFIILGK